MGMHAQDMLYLLAGLIAVGLGNGVLQILQLLATKKMHRMFFAQPSGAPPLQHNIEVLKRVNNEWVHVGFRHEMHPDLKEYASDPNIRFVKL